jgi:diketogulonate reductase-like aldo/keto reductase
MRSGGFLNFMTGERYHAGRPPTRADFDHVHLFGKLGSSENFFGEENMKYVRLGKSGLKVSAICLGCMSYGVPERGAHPWSLPEDQARPFFKKAIEAGINFFDTANVYSDGTSEEITGRALWDFAARDQIVLATKVHGRMRPDANGAGLSRKAILTEINHSLRRLGTEYVDLYQIHRWDYETSSRRAKPVTSEHHPCSRGSSPRRLTLPTRMDGLASSRCRTITTCSTARKRGK